MPLPHAASKSAVGFAAWTSASVFPAAFGVLHAVADRRQHPAVRLERGPRAERAVAGDDLRPRGPRLQARGDAARPCRRCVPPVLGVDERDTSPLKNTSPMCRTFAFGKKTKMSVSVCAGGNVPEVDLLAVGVQREARRRRSASAARPSATGSKCMPSRSCAASAALRVLVRDHAGAGRAGVAVVVGVIEVPVRVDQGLDRRAVDGVERAFSFGHAGLTNPSTRILPSGRARPRRCRPDRTASRGDR